MPLDAIQTAAEHAVVTAYRKTIWRNFIAAVQQYALISPGDRVAVCLSGGKDSLLMAVCMRALLRRSEFPFEVIYIGMDPGYAPQNRQMLENNAARLGFPLEIFDSPIFSAVDDAPRSPCHVCAAMRRGYLYKEAKKRGCNKIALGHHYDDVVETALMSLFYAGRFKTMTPKVRSDNWPGMALIRPLFLVREEYIRAWQQAQGLTCLTCACRVTKSAEGGKRRAVKQLIDTLSRDNPRLKNNIFAALSSVDADTVLGFRPPGGDRVIPFAEIYGKEAEHGKPT